MEFILPKTARALVVIACLFEWIVSCIYLFCFLDHDAFALVVMNDKERKEGASWKKFKGGISGFEFLTNQSVDQGVMRALLKFI
jgi:hypothetical protein